MDKTLSDKIAAEAAEKIVSRLREGEHLIAKPAQEWWTKVIANIVESALSQSLAARDKEIEELATKWENKRKAGSTDLIGHGMRQAECNCAADLRTLLKGKAI